MRMTISVCPFQDGTFDVIIQDPDTFEEVTLSGQQKLSDEEMELLTRLAPSCIWTTYTTEQKND